MNLGSAYVAKKEYETAIRCFQDALKIQPDNVKAHYNLGLVYFYTHEYDDANIEVL